MNSTGIKKGLVLGVVMLVLLILQTTAYEGIKINNTVPDLLFVFSVYFACKEKNLRNVLIVAFLLGVLSDFLCHSLFSGYTAVYTYSAALGYYLNNMFLKENIFFRTVLAFLLFLIGKTAVYSVYGVVFKISFSSFFAKDVIPTSVYNMACFLIVMLVSLLIKRKRGNVNE